MISTPTIIQLYNNISQDLKNKLNIGDDDLKKVLDALAMSLAGQFKLSYLTLRDIQDNIFPDTADLAENGGTLERIGQIYLGRNPRPATSGVFSVSVTGESGSVLREGLTFKSNDDSESPGKLYVLDQEYIMTGSNDIIEIRSLGGGGDFNLLVGNNLTITEPVIGVNKTVSVSEVINEPLERENTEDYRQAILDAIQLEPQGGAKVDYMLWARDAQGVRKVYPYLKENEAGTVQIYVEATSEDSTDGNGTPSSALLDSVEEVIEFDPDENKPLEERGRRPIQANIETLAISPNPVDVTITGLNINTSAIQQSIEDNLKLALSNVRPFIDGADLVSNKNDVLYAAKLQSVTTDVIGNNNFYENFEMFVNGTLFNSYEFSRENIPYLRNLNFI